MSKKFVVESIHDVPCDSIKVALDLKMGSCHHWTVTELPAIPEVKKIETGILKFTPLINFVCCDLTDSFGLKTSNFKLRTGDKMDLTKYPDLRPYCDPNSIETTWDFNSIPVGSLVEVEDDDTIKYNCKAYGRFRHANDESIHFGWQKTEKNSVKSIRIVEVAK